MICGFVLYFLLQLQFNFYLFIILFLSDEDRAFNFQYYDNCMNINNGFYYFIFSTCGKF